MSGSPHLNEHAAEAARAITIRTGRPTTHTIKGDQLMVRTAGPGLHVRYRFIPATDRPGKRWHYASIDFELAEHVEPTSLRQQSWLQAVGEAGYWQNLKVLEAELSLRSRAASRDVLQRELQARRVGLNELREASASGRNLHVSFLSPRPRSPSVIFERGAELHEALTIAWGSEEGAVLVDPVRWTEPASPLPILDEDELAKVTSPFSGDVDSGGGRTWARVSLAGHVDERYTGAVEVSFDRVEGRFQIPPTPTRLSLVPQVGVLGWLRSFAEDKLGHEALDDAFLVDAEGEAIVAFAKQQAPPLLRLRELGLHLEIADGWLIATDLDVAADKQPPVIADLLELWRQLSLELVGLRSTDQRAG